MAIAPWVAAVLALAVLLAPTLLPAEADARPSCGGRKATIVGNGKSNVIKAPKKGPQVIFAGGGDDLIIAKRGKDIVCGGLGDDRIFGGTGRDRLFGGAGNDFIDGGPGKDRIFGGVGDDVVIGGASGDLIRGGLGSDRLFGGIQDDRMFGDAGDDLLAGEHGVDRLHGGGGNDWLRGDQNIDTYFGEEGADTASFAAATPPGAVPGLDGVGVNLATGAAAGDESPERLFGIENLVGSPFNDALGGAGGGFVRGGGGSDSCLGFASISCGAISGSAPKAFIADADSPDPGLVVLGGAGADAVTVSRSGSGLVLSGSGLNAGPGCTQAGGAVICTAPPAELGYVLLWGAEGDDSLSVGPGLAVTTLVKADGGPGNDVIKGGPTADLLYAGESGADLLIGLAGDDALISRGGGADRLLGGKGNDQLVTNDPCGGHLFSGGRGKADVAGFAHTITGGVRARIGGRGKLRGAGCVGTRVKANNEVLEGTMFPDILIAKRRTDLLVGREGRDRCRGGRPKSC